MSLKKDLKIAIVAYTLKAGGLERVVSNLSFLFDELGFEVNLFVLKNEIEYPFKGKLHVYDLNDADSFLVKMNKYMKLKNDIQKGDFNFILDHRYRLNSMMEFFWTKYIYKNQKPIYFIHSSDLANYVNKNLIVKSDTKFIAVSEGIADKVKFIFPKIDVETFYNPVEVLEVNTEFTEINDNYILAVGRMDDSNVKQFDVLIDCYSKSILPKKEIKLLILGTGPKLNELKKQVSYLNLDNLVVFKGFEPEIYSFYINAKYLVLSSKYEGLGMVLIESLQCETPVISYDCDFGPNEIIQNNFNGLLVENQNKEKLIEAMNLLVEDEDLYKKCKTNAKQSVEKFSKENISKKWVRYFNDTQ